MTLLRQSREMFPVPTPPTFRRSLHRRQSKPDSEPACGRRFGELDDVHARARGTPSPLQWTLASLAPEAPDGWAAEHRARRLPGVLDRGVQVVRCEVSLERR